MRRIIIGAATAAVVVGLGWALFAARDSSDLALAPDEVSPITSVAQSKSATVHEASDAPIASNKKLGDASPLKPSAPNLLTPDGLRMVLAQIGQGKRIADSRDYQRLLEQAAANQLEASLLLANEIDSTHPSNVERRSRLFGLMIEVTLAIAANNPAEVDAFIENSLPTIRKQVRMDGRVLAETQPHSVAEARSLEHTGPYVYENGQLYAYTLQAKFMAIAVLNEAHCDVATTALASIASQDTTDPHIRQLAQLHAAR